MALAEFERIGTRRMREFVDDRARIDVPVLIVGPTRDQITTLGEAQFLAKHMPGSQLVVYEGSLHPFSAIALGPLANITLNFMR